MISFNKYVDESVARSRTVCNMAKAIKVLLKYKSKSEHIPKSFRIKCEQMLAEHHAAIHDGKGQHTSQWYDYLKE